MESSGFIVFIIWQIFISPCLVLTVREEPICSSRFDFEDRLLERSVNLAHDMKILKEIVQKALEEMKSERNKMTTELSTLSNQLKAEQESMNEKLSTSVDKIRSGINKDFADISAQLSDAIAKKINDMDTMMKLQETQVTRMGSDLRTLANATLENTKDTLVAFSVAAPNRQFVNGVPIFTKIITNIGGGYNIKSGQFTSPVAGLYQFSFTVYSSSTTANIYCRIRLNESNRVIGQAYKAQYISSSVTVVLLLRAGDIVDLGNCGGWGDVYTLYGRTAFSGVLIAKS